MAGLSESDLHVVFDQLFAFVAQVRQELTEHKARLLRLEHAATIDELTGIANARGFREFMRRTLASASRHDETGVLVYLDVDDLKLVNDRFGHDVGDLVIRRVAEVLALHTRASDFVARLHGDEFAMVLTRVGADQARTLVPAIQARIGNAPIPHDGQSIDVHVSAGLTSYDARSELVELMRRADVAMYREKRTRKNSARPMHTVR